MTEIERWAEEYASLMSFDVRGHERGFLACYRKLCEWAKEHEFTGEDNEGQVIRMSDLLALGEEENETAA